MHEEELATDILALLADKGPLGVHQIAERLEGHPLTVERVCGTLHEESHVYPLGHDRYDLTNRGMARLDDDGDVERKPATGRESEADS